ncbi:MAG: methylmalonyl-CoA mutase family protein, partial [Alphaproteobacteria bacterium]
MKAGDGCTPDGLPVEALYTRAEWAHDTGLPGMAPFVRGARSPSEAVGPIVRSRIDCDEPGDANRAIREEIAGGADGVLVVLDDAACSGDFSRPAGEGGVAVRSIEDLAVLLDGIDPRIARIDFSAGAAGAAFGQVLGEYQEKHRRELQDHLRGTLGADPLGALARFGAHPGPVEQAIADAAGLAAHIDGHVAGVRVFGVWGTPYHKAGGTPAEEIAAALASGLCYLRALVDAAMPLTRAAHHISFNLAADADFLGSIAKLRAFRRAWARVLDASGDAAAIAGLRLNAVTSQRMMAQRDPHTNLLRTTCAAAAAIIGGADAVTVLPFTERRGASALGRR